MTQYIIKRLLLLPLLLFIFSVGHYGPFRLGTADGLAAALTDISVFLGRRVASGGHAGLRLQLW